MEQMKLTRENWVILEVADIIVAPGKMILAATELTMCYEWTFSTSSHGYNYFQ